MPRISTKAKVAANSISMPLFKHQKQTVSKLRKTPVLFDMSDPGTGKTRAQIEAFAERRRKKGGRAIVIAPKSLLESAWQNDFFKFAPDISVVCAYADNRDEALNSKADVIVTNHDAVKQLGKLKPEFWKSFDTLIVDESTAFKHYTSQRSKAIAKLAQHFKYRSLMTGTPTSNGILDIWHQVFILDGGKRLGKSYFGFRSAACTPEQVGPSSQMLKWHDKPGVDLVVADMLKDISIRHVFEECVDIPPNHRYAVEYKPSKKHLAMYDDMQDFHYLQLKEKGVTAINGAVVYTKLLQIASGAVYNDNDEYSVIDTGRYEMIMDLVEARNHSIVFFNWVHQRDELVKEAERRGFSFAVYDGGTSDKERSSIVRAYQKGEYKVLFAHPQSAGHGLTLTKGTATIWASPTYNLEHFLQGLKRIHRIGQTERTETIVVIAKGTIDEKVWLVMQAKDAKQGQLLKLLKDDLADF
jgi:SNF2 family DNA or RNA helicase